MPEKHSPDCPVDNVYSSGVMLTHSVEKSLLFCCFSGTMVLFLCYSGAMVLFLCYSGAMVLFNQLWATQGAVSARPIAMGPPILPLLAYLAHKGTPHPTLSQTLWATPHISNSDTASIYMGPFREHVKLSSHPLIGQSMTFHHSGLISKYAIRCQDHMNSTKSGDNPSLPFHPCVHLRIHSLQNQCKFGHIHMRQQTPKFLLLTQFTVSQ